MATSAVMRLPSSEMLRQIRVLRPLPDPAFTELARVAHYRSYKRGMEITKVTGRMERVVYGIIDGRIELTLLSSQGKELPLRRLESGHVFVLDDIEPAGMDELVVRTVSPSTICTIPHAKFECAVTECPEAARLFMAHRGQWLKVLSGLVSDRLHDNPETRIRHMLWRETLQRGSVSLTHEQIAAKVLTDRSRATKVLGKLQGEGIVEVDSREHRIAVVNRERLVPDD